MLRVCLIVVFIGSSFCLYAQTDETQYNKLQEKIIDPGIFPDSLRLDSLSLVPASLSIRHQGEALDSSFYRYDYSTGYLYLNREFVTSRDTIHIYYRTLPFSLSNRHAHKTLAIYDSTAFFRDKNRQMNHRTETAEELFATPRLQKSGSISRGISIGNRRDLFVNASLNLQLEGALSDDLNIRASITDQNVPIQPEGNSQQIQDFDNVLVELYNQHFSLTAGDVVLQQGANRWQGNTRLGSNLSDRDDGPYFLRYRRNVQGGLLQLRRQEGKNAGSETQAGFALAKGKFASMQLQVQEGIQGPYQLRAGENQTLSGTNGARLGAFFIIANSEKVYLDGELLERGLDRDYIIDYNLGEITFTSRVLLTRYSRVFVDFEYADRNYSRSIFTASHRQQLGAVSVYAHYYREADNPHQGLGFKLDDDEKWLLSEAGDVSHHVWIPAVDSVSQLEKQTDIQTNRNADVPGVGNLYQVYYHRKDTIVDGEIYEVYVYEGQQGDFKVDFSFVGQGQGNYELMGTSVNSKVYRWIAPLAGQSRGSYAPLRPLSAPRSQELLVLGSNARLSAKDALGVELAVSNQDLNVLSDHDSHDDQGRALMLRYRGQRRKLGDSGYGWSTSTHYEYRQQYFTEVDPYRSVEFERDWFVQPYRTKDSSDQASDHILSSRLKIEKDAANQLMYQWTGRKQEQLLQGQQHRLSLHKSLGRLQFSSRGFLMRSQLPAQLARWKRLDADLHLKNKLIQPGYTFRLDKNQQSLPGSDSVTFTTMNFEEHQFYIQKGDSLQASFRLDYGIRRDFLPHQGRFLQSDLMRTLRATANLNFFKHHQFSLQMAHRQLAFHHDSLFIFHEQSISEVQNNILLGQLNWSGSMVGGVIRSQLHYNLANGREPRREFVYVRVPVGEGAYTWRDDNANGVEELDEFYEARYFDERNYVRVFVPGSDFLLAYTNTLNYQLSVQPPAAWQKKDGIRRLLGRFSSLTSWQMSKRLSDERLEQRLLPMLETPEEQLLSVRENLRSTLFFNRRQTDYGAELGIRRLRRKQLLNTGFEERNQDAYLLNLRWNPDRLWGIRWQGEKGEEVQRLDIGSQGQNAGQRDFRITYYELSPELSWQPRMNIRIAGSYTFTQRENLGGTVNELENELSRQHVLGLEIRQSKLMKHSLDARVDYVYLSYNGEENSPVAYEMLDGLRSGTNLRWTVNWQQHLLDGLQLTLNYFGRKSEESRTVHAGTLMLRALF